MSHNILQELPKQIGKLQNLFTLNVSNNKIKSIPVKISHL